VSPEKRLAAAGFQPQNVETDDSIVFMLDPDLRIVYCNAAWDLFASQNNGVGLLRSTISGTAVLDVIPEPLKSFMRVGLARSRRLAVPGNTITNVRRQTGTGCSTCACFHYPSRISWSRTRCDLRSRMVPIAQACPPTPPCISISTEFLPCAVIAGAHGGWAPPGTNGIGFRNTLPSRRERSPTGCASTVALSSIQRLEAADPRRKSHRPAPGVTAHNQKY